PYEVIRNSMTGTFKTGVELREMPDFNVFFRYNATYPYYIDCIWFLTQMARWGQLTEGQPDTWYEATARKIYRPDIYLEAVRELIDDGHFSEQNFNLAFEAFENGGYKPPTRDFIDGHLYDGRRPNEYIKSFEIGLK